MLSRNFLVILSLVSLSACGKYGPPLPPEAVSPSTISKLEVKASDNSIAFNWEAPDSDQRARPLKSIDGYRVYRKQISKRGDIADADVSYSLLGEIKDSHLVQLNKLRMEAEAKGQPTHRVKTDPNMSKFAFEDPRLQLGAQYIYRIAPYNQGNIEGRVAKLVKVNFNGAKSEISMINNPDDYPLELKSRARSD